MASGRPVLLLGAPRSGTTWIGLVLGGATGVRYVHEPDNETNDPFALRAKRGLGRFPVLEPGESARRYATCWRGAFAGGGWSRRTARMRRRLDRVSNLEVERWVDPNCRDPVALRLIAAGSTRMRAAAVRPVVKSVHGLLAGAWIAERFDPLLVLIRRHPLNVVASWRAAADGGPEERALEYSGALRGYIPDRARVGLPAPPEERLERLAWVVGLLLSARERLAALPDVTCLDHDVICRDPEGELRATAERLGLAWNDECARRLEEMERPGDGFATARIAAEQPGRWRTRLSGEEPEAVERVLAGFPGGPWFGSEAP